MALGEAMRVEYLAITDAGFILQIDDPRMATHYNRQVDASVDDCRKFIALRVETLNHALRGIPEDHVRFHTCYSVNIAPRVHDFELKHFVDLMLKVRAGDLRHGRIRVEAAFDESAASAVSDFVTSSHAPAYIHGR